HPEAMNFLNKHKNEYVFEGVINNIEQGVREGLYRKEVKPEMIGIFYMGIIGAISKESDELYETYSKDVVLSSFINYHLRGILSAKGIEYMKTIENDKD